jgi:hypothetical protein
MASRSVASPSGNSGRNRRPMPRRGALPSMSEKQTQAYLIAREALRRIRMTSSLVLPPPDGQPNPGDRPAGTQSRLRNNS